MLAHTQSVCTRLSFPLTKESLGSRLMRGYESCTSCSFLHCGQESLVEESLVEEFSAIGLASLSAKPLRNPSYLLGDFPRRPHPPAPRCGRRSGFDLVLKIPLKHFSQKVWQQGSTLGFLKWPKQTLHLSSTPSDL